MGKTNKKIKSLAIGQISVFRAKVALILLKATLIVENEPYIFRGETWKKRKTQLEELDQALNGTTQQMYSKKFLFFPRTDSEILELLTNHYTNSKKAIFFRKYNQYLDEIGNLIKNVKKGLYLIDVNGDALRFTLYDHPPDITSYKNQQKQLKQEETQTEIEIQKLTTENQKLKNIKSSLISQLKAVRDAIDYKRTKYNRYPLNNNEEDELDFEIKTLKEQKDELKEEDEKSQIEGLELEHKNRKLKKSIQDEALLENFNKKLEF